MFKTQKSFKKAWKDMGKKNISFAYENIMNIEESNTSYTTLLGDSSYKVFVQCEGCRH